MKEILVHLSAPTSRKDDEHYRKLAEAYDDFEPATTIDCTARAYVTASVNRDDHPTRASSSSYDLSRSPAKSRVVRDGSPHASSVEAGPDDSATETPAAVGFVEPAQIVPASRQLDAKGKRSEKYARAPDFGSFTSTPTSSRAPLDQLQGLEPRWTQQQRSSVKRSASGQSKTSTRRGVRQPLYAEDIQKASGVLEDHVDTTFYGSDAAFSDIDSPIAQRAGKIPRLSSELRPAEAVQAAYGPGTSEPVAPPIPIHWVPPPWTPPRRSMSSQMIDESGLSNSESPYRASDDSGPVIGDKGGPHDTLSSAGGNIARQPADSSNTHNVNQEEVAAQTLRSSQVSTQEEAGSSNHSEVSPLLNEHPADADYPPAPSIQPHSVDPESPPVREPPECDFASLPLQLLPKAAALPSETKRVFNEVTSMLQLYAEKASIVMHYRPAAVAREIRPTERGCWMFDASGWECARQHEFWTRMQYLVEHGYLGNAWLQRNVPEDWRRRGTDGNEARGLGWVWLFCWGQAAPYLWIVLLTESHLEIRRKASRARWVVGPMESLEVVVKMPEPSR